MWEYALYFMYKIYIIMKYYSIQTLLMRFGKSKWSRSRAT